jgi:predicted permease
VAAFSVTLPASQYKDGQSRLAFFRSLDERLRAIPGVKSVGFALGVPFMGGGGSTPYVIKSVPLQPGEPQRHADQAFVYGDYFATMGIRITRGRAFSATDFAGGPPVMVVDETLVHASFGGKDPIGTEIEHGPQGTIIGVARPVKLSGLDDPSHPLVYHDYGHTAAYVPSLTAVVRTSLPLNQITSAARTAMTELDPQLPVVTPRWIADRVSDSVGPRQLATTVIAGFAAVALVLALLGVYAVMTYMVNQRSREIGIRVALGAQRNQVARMVLRDGAVLAALGLGIGAVAFVGLGRVVRSLLYGVTPDDPVAIGSAVALLGAVTLVACWLPARRATRVDPAITLRAE